jgi:hypothetical protein
MNIKENKNLYNSNSHIKLTKELGWKKKIYLNYHFTKLIFKFII